MEKYTSNMNCEKCLNLIMLNVNKFNPDLKYT